MRTWQLEVSLERQPGESGQSYISKGYTRALARTAPVEPATARPHGGSGAGFDCAAILTVFDFDFDFVYTEVVYTKRIFYLDVEWSRTRSALE